MMTHRKLRTIAWAAGFLEGEGAFYVRRSDTRGLYLSVEADQKHSGPPKRLYRTFGGKITTHECNNPRRTQERLVHWRWKVTGCQAAAVMMTIYSFMCRRRKQKIRECLEVWLSTRDHQYWVERLWEQRR